MEDLQVILRIFEIQVPRYLTYFCLPKKGVHLAYRLKEKGFKNVTILEKSNRVGGKAETFTYRDTTIPLAVLLYTSVYSETLLPLLRQFNFTLQDDAPIANFASYWPVNNDSINATNSISTTPWDDLEIAKALAIYEYYFLKFFGTLNNRYGVSWIKCLNIKKKP